MAYYDTPRITTREGVELYDESSGEDTAITLLNNFFINAPFWREYTTELVQHHRVVKATTPATRRAPPTSRRSRPGKSTRRTSSACSTAGDRVDLPGAHGLHRARQGRGTGVPGPRQGTHPRGPGFGDQGMRRHRQLNRSWCERRATTDGPYAQMYPEVISGGDEGGVRHRAPGAARGLPRDVHPGGAHQRPDPRPDRRDSELLSLRHPAVVIALGDDDILLSPRAATSWRRVLTGRDAERHVHDPEGFQTSST